MHMYSRLRLRRTQLLLSTVRPLSFQEIFKINSRDLKLYSVSSIWQTRHTIGVYEYGEVPSLPLEKDLPDVAACSIQDTDGGAIL